MCVCPVCRNKVKYRYSDNGKLVHTLGGDIYQVVNFKFFLIPKIVNKTVSSLKSALREARLNYEDARSLHCHFQQIRKTLGALKTSQEEKEEK